jgi:hypothetical protein
LYYHLCFVFFLISSDVLWLPLFQMLFCDYLYFKWCFVIAFISNDILWLSLFQVMFCDCLYFKWYFVIIFISNDVLLFYVFVALYTQSPVLMLQYHLSTTKNSTVPMFIRYVLLYVCCILHTITCTNVTISHINNQTFYHSRVYTVYHFMFVVLYTQALVLMLQYHISTTKHSTVPVFIRKIILCSLYFTHNH